MSPSKYPELEHTIDVLTENGQSLYWSILERAAREKKLQLQDIAAGPPVITLEIQKESRGQQLAITLNRHHENNSEVSLEKAIPLALPISKGRAATIIITVAFITFLNCVFNGLMVVSLPTIAHDINLKESLLLWPASVTSLACGCTLLLFGSIADVVGGRRVYLIGTFVLAATSLACGVATNGITLILFRAAQGLAMSLCLPSSILLITSNIPTGSMRNIAFACLGAAQPVGFGVGLIVSGVFIGGIGWRYGFYIGAAITLAVFLFSVLALPIDAAEAQSTSYIMHRIRTEIDWVGCFLLSTSLGIFSYTFSVLANGFKAFLTPVTLVLSPIAVLLLVGFAYYTVRQEKLGRKVILPPSLWRNRAFTSLCITVFLVWGSFNASQFFITLFFQRIQGISAIQTSIRFLPQVVVGAAINFLTGWLVKFVPGNFLVFVSAAITTATPLLMAIINPAWSYWTCAFIALVCIPVCADVLFTVANLLITEIFPPETHGLAGGVFNTLSNVGNSVGLAVTAVVASSVTMKGADTGRNAIDLLMDGYRATFWVCFGANILVLFVVAIGLRGIGKVGSAKA